MLDLQDFPIPLEIWCECCIQTGGTFAGASKPGGCKYCNDDAALPGNWPELLSVSPLGKQQMERRA